MTIIKKNGIYLSLSKNDVEFNKTYRLYITSVPSDSQKPEGSVAEFHFAYEDGKLFIRYTKGGNVFIIKKSGENRISH